MKWNYLRKMEYGTRRTGLGTRRTETGERTKPKGEPNMENKNKKNLPFRTDFLDDKFEKTVFDTILSTF
jgi:hypothetical protein